MYTAVRKGVQQALAKDDLATNGGKDSGGMDFIGLKDVLKDKASVEMLDNVKVHKANKIDLEMCMRWVDMLHKMCNSLATLHTLNFKTALDIRGNESANAKQNRNVILLHQSLVIEKWIESFDSKRVNTFFYSEEMKRDPRMI